MAELPVFFNEDAEVILSEMSSDMEQRLGRSLNPADIETLLIQGFAYREQLIRIQGNEAARQNLVTFATGSSLDFLGKLVGVTRLPALAAVCKLSFTLVSGHSAVTLPLGLRVQSLDGKIIFKTQAIINIAEGVNTATVDAIATTEGKAGNGYSPGQISLILDPQAYLVSAGNTDTSGGGSDAETDDQLRERIELAPATFSVAGPTGAYKYFAKSANPAIVDVAVLSQPYFSPGEVHLFPLMEGGILPNAEVLAEVLAICDNEKVRPLTDTVFSDAPVKIDYSINVQLTLFNDAIEAETRAEVNNALSAYRAEGLDTLGRDVKRNRIIQLCMIPGKVYDVNIVSPAADIIADPKTYTNCTGITVTTIGFNEG